MKAFLENFAAILGASTLALLLMSASHEYAYFWAVVRFFQTFLATSGYFSKAVLRLPGISHDLHKHELGYSTRGAAKPYPTLSLVSLGDIERYSVIGRVYQKGLTRKSGLDC